MTAKKKASRNSESFYNRFVRTRLKSASEMRKDIADSAIVDPPPEVRAEANKSWEEALADGSFRKALRDNKFKDLPQPFVLTSEEQQLVLEALSAYVIVSASQPGKGLPKQVRGAHLKTINRLSKRLKKALGA